MKSKSKVKYNKIKIYGTLWHFQIVILIITIHRGGEGSGRVGHIILMTIWKYYRTWGTSNLLSDIFGLFYLVSFLFLLQPW